MIEIFWALMEHCFKKRFSFLSLVGIGLFTMGLSLYALFPPSIFIVAAGFFLGVLGCFDLLLDEKMQKRVDALAALWNEKKGV